MKKTLLTIAATLLLVGAGCQTSVSTNTANTRDIEPPEADTPVLNANVSGDLTVGLPDITNATAEEISKLHSGVRTLANGSLRYENNHDGFHLTFPASWGAIKEDEIAPPEGTGFTETIRLTHGTDPSRVLDIHVVETAHKSDATVTSAPATFIADKGGKSYFYANGGASAATGDATAAAAVNAELKSIAATFK